MDNPSEHERTNAFQVELANHLVRSHLTEEAKFESEAFVENIVELYLDILLISFRNGLEIISFENVAETMAVRFKENIRHGVSEALISELNFFDYMTYMTKKSLKILRQTYRQIYFQPL